MTIRVLVADDQEMVRTGFRMILSADADIEVVADARDGREAVTTCRRYRPDVILMDIQMPVLDGLAATREIRTAAGRDPAIVILTTFDSDDYLFEALAAGASGFLLKHAPATDLIRAVHTVAAGDALLAPAVTRRVIDRARRARGPDATEAVRRLSEREREVLRLMADGLSNKEIAQTLVVGEATVKTHVARVLQKLPARDRVQAVITAFRSGLVDEPSL
jgi:DNA-binding NarL/FixJ family response regulator